MANDLNQCNFIGRLGKDPEVKYLSSGQAVANFSIACSDDYKDKQTGSKVEKTNWINISVFGRLAEICGEYLRKGSQVFISGKQVTRKWQDKDGQDRYTTEIVADKMQMLGGNNGGQQQSQEHPQRQPQQNQPTSRGEVVDIFPDDIPF